MSLENENRRLLHHIAVLKTAWGLAWETVLPPGKGTDRVRKELEEWIEEQLAKRSVT